MYETEQNIVTIYHLFRLLKNQQHIVHERFIHHRLSTYTQLTHEQTVNYLCVSSSLNLTWPFLAIPPPSRPAVWSCPQPLILVHFCFPNTSSQTLLLLLLLVVLLLLLLLNTKRTTSHHP